ncbi:MAG: hypothetical protein JO266_14555 [Acidobacteria bacterium]|nr:hypothetical protein [Acidobacteriota bacterium]
MSSRWHARRRRAFDIGRAAAPRQDYRVRQHDFFDAKLLGMEELSYRTVIDLQSVLAKFRHEPAQSEVAASYALSEHPACSPEIALGM